MKQLLLIALLPLLTFGQSLQETFQNPPEKVYPETWFHLIGGNVNKIGLTTDLEAVSHAGFQGIQLFHGRGRPWLNFQPQIQTLSPKWDDLIEHVADETNRLDLKFTMQNCPGWAMSGGPWITPDKAMRHLIWSRKDFKSGTKINLSSLPQPQPSQEDWRDYRDVAVLAFPTPQDDTGQYLQPSSITSNLQDQPWTGILNKTEKQKNPVQIPANGNTERHSVDFTFDNPTTLRSIEFPPLEHLMKRWHIDTDSYLSVHAEIDGKFEQITRVKVPRGTWQDRQPEHPFVLAVADATSKKFRLVFENNLAMELYYLRLSSAARLHNWHAQAAYALRTLERQPPVQQDPATFVNFDHIIDLTGQKTWTAPQGANENWTILRYGHVNTGKKNKPAPPEATGFECDKLSKAGAEQHFAGYIGRLTKEGGPADKGRLQGMLIDSWECYTQTWTPAMEQEFADRRSYALRQWFPAISGYIVNDHRTTERFLRDWRKTISDLLVENYFGHLATLARSRGLELSFETALGDIVPGDVLEFYKAADNPMCEVWMPNDPHWGGLEMKPILPTASAARLYGQNIVAAEAFTNISHKWDDHLFSFKYVADRCFADGINQLVFHTYTHNPIDKLPGTSFGNRIGSPFLRGQTWWKFMPKFVEYLARCQSLLRAGSNVADVLSYLGDDLDHRPSQVEPFVDGYHFDYLNQDVLHNHLKVVNGSLQTGNDHSWQILFLKPQACDRLTPATLRKLRQLLENGATVVGLPPKTNPTLTEAVNYRALVESIWKPGIASQSPQKFGKGTLVPTGNLAQALKDLKVTPDLSGIKGGNWIHRQIEDQDIYFVTASRNEPLKANLTFRATGKPEFYDPLTGKTRPVKFFDQKDGKTIIPIDLPHAGSIFVVFSPGKPKPGLLGLAHGEKELIATSDKTRIDKSEKPLKWGLPQGEDIRPWIDSPDPTHRVSGDQLILWKNGDYKLTTPTAQEFQITKAKEIPLTGPWQLHFPSGWDTPQEILLNSVQPWSSLRDPATRAFSGTATYTKRINLWPANFTDHVMLDLGKVSDAAEVRINGQKVGLVWAAPYRLDVAKFLRKGENIIEIDVTNTWHNRLVHDASLPEAKRKTWTMARPEADRPLKPAGLTGPVTLRIGQAKKL